MVFEQLAAKHQAKAMKKAPVAPKTHLIPGAVPVSQAEFKVLSFFRSARLPPRVACGASLLRSFAPAADALAAHCRPHCFSFFSACLVFVADVCPRKVCVVGAGACAVFLLCNEWRRCVCWLC